MGKTTVGQMFADLKVPLLDADASVHELYARGGAAVSAVQRLFPDAVVDGTQATPLRSVPQTQHWCSTFTRPVGAQRCVCVVVLSGIQI